MAAVVVGSERTECTPPAHFRQQHLFVSNCIWSYVSCLLLTTTVKIFKQVQKLESNIKKSCQLFKIYMICCISKRFARGSILNPCTRMLHLKRHCERKRCLYPKTTKKWPKFVMDLEICEVLQLFLHVQNSRKFWPFFGGFSKVLQDVLC